MNIWSDINCVSITSRCNMCFNYIYVFIESCLVKKKNKNKPKRKRKKLKQKLISGHKQLLIKSIYDFLKQKKRKMKTSYIFMY